MIGAVERRQTLPILTNVLVSARERELTLTTTDLEMELSVRVELQVETPGETHLPARRLHDILRALPDDASVALSVEGDKATVRCGRSRFTLITLPAGDFPTLEDFTVRRRYPPAARHSAQPDRAYPFRHGPTGRALLPQRFAAGSQPGVLRLVATDGHRLAFQELPTEVDVSETRQVIVPRKGVLELLRLFGDNEVEATIRIGANHIRLVLGDVCLTSKLIEGKFPDYQRVIPARATGGDRRPVGAAASGWRGPASCSATRLGRAPATGRLDPAGAGAEFRAGRGRGEVEINYSGGPLEVGFNVICSTRWARWAASCCCLFPTPPAVA